MSNMPELYSFDKIARVRAQVVVEDDIATEEELLKDFLDATPREVIEEMMEAQKVILSLAAYVKHLKEDA
jgi:hypothetical protein